MLYKIRRAISKEIRLLLRDTGGLMIIFLMPMLLIITVTMIQDSTFKNFDDTRIPLIFIDKDHGEIASLVRESISQGHTFDIVKNNFTEDQARQAVANGDYQMAIVLPENLSKTLGENISFKVEQIISSLGYSPENAGAGKPPGKSGDIRLYFDPATNLAFKDGVKNAIDKMVFQIENRKIYSAFSEQLGAGNDGIKQEKLIAFKEISPSSAAQAKPNSVQHNVPAWALFAIFLVVVPLSISMVKEKQQGTMMRLHTSPAPYIVHIFGKTAAYLIICILQFLLMVAVGAYIFPHIGLRKFEVGDKLPLLLFVTVFAGLAAIGFSILVGTVAKTQEQSAPFGATAVVILAAVGGIWVPVFMMPEAMQRISKFSPMNWGLEAYYNILLRDRGIATLLPQAGLLLLFYAVCVAAALLYDKQKKDA